jgi:RNA polymerase sigma factor (sigma-70 family)
MKTETMAAPEPNDADLVAESLAGSRDAFRQIVERYQTLICSLAYSATGNMSQSEDVAQETFINAWKDLRCLREPDKLRAWLCAIVRNRIQRNFRKEGRESVRNAAPLENVEDSPAPEALPSEQAISREEEAILWRSLEKIPELYSLAQVGPADLVRNGLVPDQAKDQRYPFINLSRICQQLVFGLFSLALVLSCSLF